MMTASKAKPKAKADRAQASMTSQLPTLEVRNRRQWRAWLKKHHASSAFRRGVWLVFHKAHTTSGGSGGAASGGGGAKSMLYEDMVREALCFGWIDSLIKRLDDHRYARKVTPRKPTSKWSALNRERWNELKAAGLLTPAGLAAAPPRRPTDNTYGPKPVIPTLPGYIAKAFATNAKAWAFFRGRDLPPRERRNFVVWIHTAKRPDTRERRIRESIALLAAGKRLGLR